MGRISSNKRTKRALSLLEVTIALLLTSILITILLKIYFQLPKVEKKIDDIKQKTYPVSYTQVKLSKVFNKLIPPQNLSPLAKKYPPLSTYCPQEQEESLLVIFDNGIDMDPNFSGEVIGRIYVNKESNTLELIIWPIDGKKHSKNFRKEVLLENVSSFTLNFFDPTPDTEEKDPLWATTWEEKSYFPPMIKIELAVDEIKESFYFFPPASSSIITFKPVKKP